MGTGGIEKTVRLVLDLPAGQDWAWLPDCNIIVLGSHLTAAGQEIALSELQSTWRRQFIKAVPDEPPGCPDVA